ncbi:MAG: T9SS type A sorting domain-containing protein [Ignavibacteriales bacterium]|nr:MAG: T9SS type A sorting domain-containing protein [Ignavibacteriales bacterium]
MRVITILLFFVCFISTLQSQQTPVIMDSLIIRDTGGNSRTLNFGIDPTASDSIDMHLGEALLPPFPPGFEARYYLPKNNFDGTYGSYSDFRQGTAPFTGSVEHRIRMQKGASDTVLFEYNLPASINIRLQDGIVGTLLDTMLTGSGSYMNPNPLLYELFKVTVIYDNTTDINESDNVVDDYALLQNYPNPFNPSTTISFKLKENSFVKIHLYNVLGKEAGVITEQFYSAGFHSVNFDASDLAAGVYYYRIISSNFSETKKMVLLK